MSNKVREKELPKMKKTSVLTLAPFGIAVFFAPTLVNFCQMLRKNHSNSMKQLRFKIDFVELRIFMNHLTFREFVRIVGSGVPSNFREVSDSEGPGAYRRNGMSKVKPWRPAAPSSPACFRRPPPSFCGVFHLFQAVRKGF